MNCKPWTVALIGIGIVSLPSVIRAEEKTSPLQTVVAGTTISGYVDTSAHWNLGTGNANLPVYTPNGQSGLTKADGFNLDVVELTISKAAGDEPWSAGYSSTLLLGPDAVGYNTSFLGKTTAAPGDFGLKDTYVDLHAPLGNGLDVKLGTFASPLGYEVYEAGSNPNYTRSYGYEIEPTQLTGLIAAYQVCPSFAVSGGIANTWSAGINSRAFNTTPAKAESFKSYVGNLAFTAPTNWGSFAGSTISAGVVSGWDAMNLVDKTSFYAGATLNTPITNVKVGVGYDYAALGDNTISGTHKDSGYQNATGVYLLWQATDKLSFNTRGEYFSQSGYLAAGGWPRSAFEVTETIQYDLWKNVVSRVEFRWDHDQSGTQAFTTPGSNNAYLIAANLIYKF